MGTVANGGIGIFSGDQEIVGLVGFGSNDLALRQGTQIILVNPLVIQSTAIDFAFSVPRAGTITSIAAFFAVTASLNLGPVLTATVSAQLYKAPATNNTYDPIGPVITLSPTLTGLINAGFSLHNTATGLSIPVAAEDRLMMVYSSTVPSGVLGVASAGVNIV
ncbi:hypothetical protein ET33_31275 [Paenibacillus tyrfis]|uniref:BclB domain-containing protein n=2 Tax=Paenibacillus tyrfis TaxID=1501230 RepID=A0A081P6M9_9BACL|nr:hypothetical protein ET33_31275 [Paenibacillus tyrfis]